MVPVVLTGFALAGISGCEVPEADAVISVRDYYAALERGDAKAACRQLTPAAVSELVARLGTSCDRGVLRIALAPQELRDAQVAHARVSGSNGTVKVVLLGSDPTVPLRTPVSLIDGRWRISDPYSPYSTPQRLRR